MRILRCSRRTRRRIMWGALALGIGFSTASAVLEWGLLLLIPDLKNMTVPDPVLSFRLKRLSCIRDYSTLLWEGRVNEYCVGQFGDRVPPGLPSHEPHHPLVLCCGDSHTFGLGVPWDQSYPARLAAYLGRGVAVLNLGVPAYNAWQSRKLAEEEIARWSPDILVFQVSRNDDDPEFPVYDIYSSPHPPRTRVGCLLRCLWIMATCGPKPLPTQSARDAVMDMFRITTSRGIPMILLRAGDPPSLAPDGPSQNPPLPPCPSVSADDLLQQFCQRSGHLTGAGNDLVAKRLAEMIGPILFARKGRSNGHRGSLSPESEAPVAPPGHVSRRRSDPRPREPHRGSGR